jgi:hypothetical protein
MLDSAVTKKAKRRERVGELLVLCHNHVVHAADPMRRTCQPIAYPQRPISARQIVIG